MIDMLVTVLTHYGIAVLAVAAPLGVLLLLAEAKEYLESREDQNTKE